MKSIGILALLWLLVALPVHSGEPTSTGRFSHDQLIGYAARYGTPLYVYDGDLIERKFTEFKQAFDKVYPRTRFYYALKANTSLAIVSILRNLGAGAECISRGEIEIALRLGWKGPNILFTSSSKSPDDLALAVRRGVTVNLDSLGDLDNLIRTAEKLRRKVRISFRINPDVDPKTHRHIATGHKFSKFGILADGDEVIRAYRKAKECRWLQICGIHSHIGSQILDLEPFSRNVELVTSTVKRLKKELGIDLEFIDLGGGLGIPYEDGKAPLAPEAMAQRVAGRIRAELEGQGPLPTLALEPGRYFVAQSGLLIARVNSVKHTPFKHFINVDTGFNHLVRPLLYEAYHRVRVLGGSGPTQTYDLAGNICETGDILAQDRVLPTPKVGDCVAFLDAGAYGFSMASEYNSIPLPAEILVRGKRVAQIRRRGTLDDLLRNQSIPKDLR